MIERGGPLNGICAMFADEVFIKTLTADYDDDELERLVTALVKYQPALNRFAQAALGRSTFVTFLAALFSSGKRRKAAIARSREARTPVRQTDCW